MNKVLWVIFASMGCVFFQYGIFSTVISIIYMRLNLLLAQSVVISMVYGILSIFFLVFIIFVGANPQKLPMIVMLISEVGFLIVTFMFGLTSSDSPSDYIMSFENNWNYLFQKLQLDDIQKPLRCCGFSRPHENPGRNSFCHREDIRMPPCAPIIIEKLSKRWNTLSIFSFLSSGCLFISFFFGLLYFFRNPKEEESPDADAILAQGLL